MKMRSLIRSCLLLVGACLLAFAGASAQQTPGPAKQPLVSTDLGVTYSPERAEIAPGRCCFWLQGGGADVALTFRKGFGIAASLTGEHASNVSPDVDVNKIAYLAGPRYTYNAWAGHLSRADNRRLQIFGQGLLGGVHGFDGVYPAPTAATTSAGSFALEAGGGLNLFLSARFGLRLLEAEYVRTALPNNGSDTQNDLRLAFGIIYHLGATVPPPPLTLTCAATPASIFPGDPMTLTATAGNLDPKLNTLYSWSGPGVNATVATTSVATAALQPGNYTMKCSVKEGKPGKEGLRPWQSTEGSASFTVKQFEPPTIICSANPTTLNPGDSSTVTATGMSPQNRPLTYSYSVTAGTIAGSGNTATFSSTGAPTGTTGITCNVTDDKGQAATAQTSVTITAPYVPPTPHSQVLCSISFARDKKRPTRVDNESKACLDEVALALQRQSDAKAIVVGESTTPEKTPPMKSRKHAKAEEIAGERAVNTKDYLVTEKGIDGSRIGVATCVFGKPA